MNEKFFCKLNLANLFQNFQTNCALSGNDIWMIYNEYP